MKLKLLFTTTLVWISLCLSAQQLNISGTITDAKDGSPMPGVNVILKGTTKGTISTVEGTYSIQAEENATLVFSFLGYAPKEIVVTSATQTVNVALEPQVTGLDEIIVIGYGTQKKSDKTGAVTNITSEELNKGSITDPIQGMQGKAAGVMITKKGGDPSSGFSVKIRGQASFFSSTEPLYVVDGVPGVDPTTIAPDDIESFNVLKDASSTAIYGARASSGVILITTKRGKVGTSTVTYNGYMSFDQVANRLDLLSASDIRQYVADNNLGAKFTDGGADVDWQKEIYRTGISQSHNINFSGGNEATSYNASLTHNEITGVVKGSGKVRDIARVNLIQKAIDNKLTVAASLSGTLEHNDYIDYNGYGPKDVLYQAFERNPTDPIRNANGTFYEINRDFNYTNPLNLIENIQNERDAKRYLGNLKLDFEITKSLSTGLNLAYIRDDNENFYFVPLNLYAEPNGEGRRNYDNKASSVLEYTINYNKVFNDVHNVNIVGGYSFQEDVVDGFKAQGTTPLSNYVEANNLNVLTNVNIGDITSYKESNKIISFFGRAAYNYNSKYYFTGTVRRDGSSKFGAGNKWGIFPSASVAWNIANEDFIKSGLSQINQLKLRAGWGIAGNQNFDRYNSLVAAGVKGTAIDPETGKTVVAFTYLYNANPNLKWEQNEELNIGLDFGLFENRISGSLEYYRKQTHDLLAKIDVPTPPNLASQTWVNGGQINNNGFEANLQVFIVNKRDITWKSAVTYSTNKQNVDSLTSAYWLVGDISGRGMTSVQAQRIAPGYEMGTFYGLKYAGIDQKTGLFKFLSIHGDTVLNSSANSKVMTSDSMRMPIGNALPRYEFGFSNYFTFFKNFDFSFSIHGVMGFDVLNVTKMVFSNPNNIPSLNGTKDVLGEIKKGLKDKPIYSDYYLEDGSFIRLDNITLGYTINFQKYKYIKSCRVYSTASNVLTITDYTGIDPEVTYSGLSFGIDQYNVYPKTMTLTFGLNLTF